MGPIVGGVNMGVHLCLGHHLNACGLLGWSAGWQMVPLANRGHTVTLLMCCRLLFGVWQRREPGPVLGPHGPASQGA